MKHIEYLKSLRACPKGLNYARRFSTLSEAWMACDVSMFMLWLLKNTNKSTKKQNVEIGVRCVERVLNLWENKHPGDLRPQQAITAAKTWMTNPCLLTRLAALHAAHASWAAGGASIPFARIARGAASSAYAVAYTPEAMTYASSAADDAAWAMADAADGSYYNAFNATRAAERKSQAEIIRSVVGNPFSDM